MEKEKEEVKMNGKQALMWCELIMEYDGLSVFEVLNEKSRGSGSTCVTNGNENLRELFRTMNNNNKEVHKENRRERAARYKGGKARRRE